MPKKSKRLVKSNTRFSITQMKNFLEELRDFFFLGCNKSKRVVKRMIPLSENVHHTGHSLLALSWMLGSKDLGFYVFRTLICIVGKP